VISFSWDFPATFVPFTVSQIVNVISFCWSQRDHNNVVNKRFSQELRFNEFKTGFNELKD
jgi:hypothetical protein